MQSANLASDLWQDQMMDHDDLSLPFTNLSLTGVTKSITYRWSLSSLIFGDSACYNS